MRTKRFVLANTFVVISLLAFSLVLAACGSDNTPAATTTSAATMNVNNDGGPATKVSTNVTASAATPAANSSLPAVKGTTELTLDQNVILAANSFIPGATNPTFKILVSADSSDNLTTATNNAFLNAGYTFAFPGATQPIKQGDTTVALYTKSGSPDVLISIRDVPTDVTVLSRDVIPGLQADAAQKLLGQLKSQKSMMLVVTANHLMQFLGAQAGLTPPTGAVTTALTTPAPTANGTNPTATAIPVSENDLPLYANSTKAVGPTTLGDTFSISYVTSDAYDSVVTWAKSAYTAKGWQGITSNEQAGATIFTGRKNSATLIATIMGPQARSNAGFDTFFKQANAGPNDTVIVVVVTY